MCVCVCVCVCEAERGLDLGRQGSWPLVTLCLTCQRRPYTQMGSSGFRAVASFGTFPTHRAMWFVKLLPQGERLPLHGQEEGRGCKRPWGWEGKSTRALLGRTGDQLHGFPGPSLCSVAGPFGTKEGRRCPVTTKVYGPKGDTESD